MSMQPLRSIAGVALGVCLFVACGSAVFAAESSPAFSFYQNYVEQTAKAESLDEVGEFMPAWWNDRQRSASAADQSAAVERIRKVSGALEEVSLEREESVDGGVRLHMTARSGGLPMQGTVLLIKESGAFKVEESKWRSVEPLVN